MGTPYSVNIYNIRNAKIVGASLSNADHGVLSSFIRLEDRPGSSIGFGGCILYHPEYPSSKSFAGHFIYRVLEIAGVRDWKQLVGCYVRAKFNSNDTVEAIGHIVNDDWFSIKDDYFKIVPKEPAE